MFWSTIAGVALLGLAACADDAIWLATPAGAAKDLAFNFGRRRGHPERIHVNSFIVSQGCGGSGGDYWSIENTGDLVPTLEHLRYGEVPPRYRAEVPAPPLRPGCYEAFTPEGGGKVFFEVSAAGDSVRELEHPPTAPVAER